MAMVEGNKSGEMKKNLRAVSVKVHKKSNNCIYSVSQVSISYTVDLGNTVAVRCDACIIGNDFL